MGFKPIDLEFWSCVHLIWAAARRTDLGAQFPVFTWSWWQEKCLPAVYKRAEMVEEIAGAAPAGRAITAVSYSSELCSVLTPPAILVNLVDLGKSNQFLACEIADAEQKQWCGVTECSRSFHTHPGGDGRERASFLHPAVRCITVRYLSIRCIVSLPSDLNLSYDVADREIDYFFLQVYLNSINDIH